jgi:L-threonylcarbamoyladenylate synthase
MAEIGTDISKAKRFLEQGELVAIPTETVYGLAGNALNPSVVARIFAAKDRPRFDPLIVHVPSMTKAKELVTPVPDKALRLADAFWPGPLTLLLKKKEIIPDIVTSGLEHVGIRCPDHALTRALLNTLEFPIAAPSANPFGYISPTQPRHVEEQLGTKIAYILDGGSCKIGIESTIVGFSEEGPVIYRAGGLSSERIEATIGKVSYRLNSHLPSAPGQLESHYAPRKKMILGSIKHLLTQYDSASVAVLSYRDPYPEISESRLAVLSASGNLEEAATHLFEYMRKLDKTDAAIILAERVPDEGIGRAINDRLQRASVSK